jgi:outer membrane protein assembly factor BamB
LVFGLGQFGDLVCLETATGKEHWRHNLEKDFGGKMMSFWGYSESPVVDGDKLICTPGGAAGSVAALSTKTGELLWRSTELTDSAAYCSPVIATIGGVRQYVVLTEKSVAGINPANGKLLWEAPRIGKVAVIPTPVVDGNLVYVSSGYSVGCNLFQVDSAAGAFTAQQVYASKEMCNKIGGTVKVGDALFGHSDGKGWTCQDFKTGRVLWVNKEKLGPGSLTVADGNLYLRQEGGPGTVVLLEPSLTGWTEKSHFDQPDRSQKNTWAPPVVSNGHLYLRDQDTLLAYDVKAH